MGAHAHADDHGEHKHHGWLFYTVIAGVLGVLTFIEIGPLFGWYELAAGALIALSLVKFFLVVAFFMHLWDDPPIFSQMFVAPLLGGTLMVLVLMALFTTFRPAPFSDSDALRERYGDAFAGECSSWLRSHKTQRLYCASPPVDKDRVAVLGTLPSGAAIERPVVGGGPEDDPALVASYKAATTDVDRLKVLVSAGEQIYKQQCAACHQANGQGVPPAFPPLAGSDHLGQRTPQDHAKVVINGLQGPLVVNGVTYNGAMQSFGGILTDLQIAAVVSYERNAWGNDHGWIAPEQVLAAR
jgi:mono/diheme cytochrome c family protein/cytochrome c oxidase subunit IV